MVSIYKFIVTLSSKQYWCSCRPAGQPLIQESTFKLQPECRWQFQTLPYLTGCKVVPYDDFTYNVWPYIHAMTSWIRDKLTYVLSYIYRYIYNTSGIDRSRCWRTSEPMWFWTSSRSDMWWTCCSCNAHECNNDVEPYIPLTSLILGSLNTASALAHHNMYAPRLQYMNTVLLYTSFYRPLITSHEPRSWKFHWAPTNKAVRAGAAANIRRRTALGSKKAAPCVYQIHVGSYTY
jgi:hypothetical protein